jgi:hypothetical protein
MGWGFYKNFTVELHPLVDIYAIGVLTETSKMRYDINMNNIEQLPNVLNYYVLFDWTTRILPA